MSLLPLKKRRLLRFFGQDAELKKRNSLKCKMSGQLSSLHSSDRDPISAAGTPVRGFRKRRQILFYRKRFSYAAAVMLVLLPRKGAYPAVIPVATQEPDLHDGSIVRITDRTTSFN
jgi:hypothetical protein